MDTPLVWYEGAGTTDRRFLHADERGSIVATSDSSGNKLSINRYDEYGIPGSGNSGRFGYTGQIWLSDQGMYYYKARVYSPTLGRFLQIDPTGDASGMNLYAYVGNDPLNFVDPYGLDPKKPPEASGDDIVVKGRKLIVYLAVGEGFSFGGQIITSPGVYIIGGTKVTVIQTGNVQQSGWHSFLKSLACGIGQIGANVGADAYELFGGSVGGGISFNATNGQIGISGSTGVGVGYGLDGEFGASYSRGGSTGASGIVSAGVNANIGGVFGGVSGGYSKQLIGTSPGSSSGSLGRGVGLGGHANVSGNFSFNFPALYNAGC